ncbi:MAG: nitroreductase family deazaflavin-dependent oxidoreductase [Acidimicrobiales bacterium]
MSDEAADATKAVNDWNANIIAEFRSNEGKVGGQFEGAPVLLLHTKGAKSGKMRINPMMYLDYEGKRYIFASYAGAPTNPDWYHNLVAHPEVTVEVGTETFEAIATPVTLEERDRVYPIQAERYANFAEYETKTTRKIPVVELVRK